MLQEELLSRDRSGNSRNTRAIAYDRRAKFADDSLMSNSIEWTAEAEARLKEIPFFVRPAARKKIEKLALEMGATQITVEIYEQAKQKFGS